MANYTVELRTIVNEINIFDFDYPFYNEALKSQFEQKFINHFYYREIGVETVNRFLFNLETTLNEIMPYYKHLYETSIYEYNPILNYDVKEEISRNLDETVNGIATTNSNTVSHGTNINSQYDTPITPLSNTRKTPSLIDEGEGNQENSSTGNNEVNNKTNTIEVHNRTTKGNIGVMTTQDLIMKERQIIINIDKLILDECDNLFMQVY